MHVLGVESSCDETAAAVVTEGGVVLSDVVRSQVSLHAPYGGVVPEIASRDHARAVLPVIREALARADRIVENAINKVEADDIKAAAKEAQESD